MRTPFALYAALALFAAPRFSSANELYEFFDTESTVVSASKTPKSIRRAPATVYVVTAEQIKMSGAQTLWDALRGVPGVDVMASRAGHGDVSVRGINKPLNNRTLVLVDGRSILSGLFDYVSWDSIPVGLEEIDRIEVVEGPASALYGANALNGVINIITKRPEQLPRLTLQAGAGGRDSFKGSVIAADSKEKRSLKISASGRTTDSFQHAGERAAGAGRAHIFLGWSLPRGTSLEVAGGFSQFNTRYSAGPLGVPFEEGGAGYYRIDLQSGKTKFRLYSNLNRTDYRDFPSLDNPSVHYNIYDASLERTFSLTPANTWVVGAEFRRTSIQAPVLAPSSIDDDRSSLSMENDWRLSRQWDLVSSIRFDHHPVTRWQSSPRATLMFEPDPANTLRLSAGSGFRNPTLIENYMYVRQTLPAEVPFTDLELVTRGNTDTKEEKIRAVELSHRGAYGPMRTTAAIFYYKLTDVIEGSETRILSAVPPTLNMEISFENAGTVEAKGGEFGVEASLSRDTQLFANYSLARWTDTSLSELNLRDAPRHKGNLGLHHRAGRGSFGLWMHAVDSLRWRQNGEDRKIAGYVLWNVHLGVEFEGRWQGLELSLDGFNIGGRGHRELLPSPDGLGVGLNGERIDDRVTLTATYRF